MTPPHPLFTYTPGVVMTSFVISKKKILEWTFTQPAFFEKSLRKVTDK